MAAERSASRDFETYLRTGRRSVELKFNPYHDPVNGRFTFAPGGPTAHSTNQRRNSDTAPSGERRPSDAAVETADVSQRLVNTYFMFRPDQKRNLNNNLRTLLGNKFEDKQIERILSDVLAQQQTTTKDLSAFSDLRPGPNGRLSISMRQKSIIDRFVNRLPRTALNIDAVNFYRAGLVSGRISVRR